MSRPQPQPKTGDHSARKRSNNGFLCQCNICLSESDDGRGCLLPSQGTYHSHQRDQRMRDRLASEGLDELAQATTLRALDNSSPRTSLAHRKLTEFGSKSPKDQKPTYTSKLPPRFFVDQFDGHFSQATKDLQHVRDSFIQASISYTPAGALSFVLDPPSHGPYASDEAALGINTGRHALRSQNASDSQYLKHESSLLSLLEQLDGIYLAGSEELEAQRHSLWESITFEQHRLDTFKRKEWERQRAGVALGTGGKQFDVDTCRCLSPTFSCHKPDLAPYSIVFHPCIPYMETSRPRMLPSGTSYERCLPPSPARV